MIGADLPGEGGAVARSETGGLTAILRRESTLAAELVVCVSEDGRPTDLETTWELLPAGPGARRAAALLAGSAMQAVIREARERADVVIVAAPPLCATGDILALAPVCEAIVVVVGQGTITREDAECAAEVLDTVPTPVLGVVVERVGRRRIRKRGWRGRADAAAGTRAPRVVAVTEAARRSTARA
jgi:Mrp family chromosome partitioning ATPase